MSAASAANRLRWNGDGSLSADEVRATFLELNSGNTAAVNSIPQGSGSVSRAAFKTACALLATPSGGAAALAILNAHGEGGSVSRAEFIECMAAST